MRNQRGYRAPLRERELRATMTKSERVLWGLLRDRRLATLKFRRQHRLGRFVVDFVCLRYALIVELDGAPHTTHHGVLRDGFRDAELRSLGFRVLRFENRMVALQREYVIAGILHAVEEIRSAGAT